MQKWIFGLLIVSIAAGSLWAQEDHSMEEWMKLNTPGEHHKLLEKLAGNWTAVNEITMAPDAPPMKSDASSKNALIFDGRFLESHYAGDFMGTPFTGRGLLGYDNARSVYTQFWIDSASVGMSHSEGTLSDDGKTLTMVGSANDAEDPEHRFKYVYRFESDDSYLFEFWDLMGDAETKQMTITYTRAQEESDSR